MRTQIGETKKQMYPFKVESIHAILFCSNWNAIVTFYRDILKFGVVDEKPGFVEFEVAAGSCIGLIRAAGRASAGDIPVPMVLSFRVEDIKETHRSLSERCKTITAIREHPWGALVFELKDPEGRRLEFWMSR
ncbi:MAG: VOC family protein [Acidobacteriota bacterium]